VTRFANIDRDIFRYQLVGVAEEMSKALRRSAYSSIIWDMYDYACALFTTDCEQLAQSETVTAQLGTMGTALRDLVKSHPLSTWKPGDVFVCNDPYRGCTHTPDITLFSPVFHDGELIALTSTIAHHIDIGGRFSGTTVIDNVEVFAEGLIFPPIRLIDGGDFNETVRDFIRANVRYPEVCLGDLRAQVAGCRTAERRLAEMAKRYGNERFRALAAATLDYAERYTRTLIQEIPDGVYEAEALTEDGVASEEFFRLRVRIKVDGDRINVDFPGTSEQRKCAMNCPWSSTVSMVTYAIKCLLTPDLAQNDGCNRPVTISAPEGSILNPERPAAVGARHYVQLAVADVVLRALTPAVPSRGAAGSHVSFPTFRAGGVDDRPRARTKQFVIMDILGGGMGGSPQADGLNAVDTHGGNCALLSAEVMEMLSPIRVQRSALVPKSGGAGEFRGGLAIERVYEVLSETALGAVRLQQGSIETLPWGFAGGSSGAKAEAILNPETPSAQPLPLHAGRLAFSRGDTILVRSAGGAGFGPESQRNPTSIERDQVEGYV
jgi:N-methylhydantoinase B